MRVRNNKDGSKTFTYKGDLQKAIDAAKIELNRKSNSEEFEHLRWAYEKAKREYLAYNNRIHSLREFIKAAEKKLNEPVV